MSLEYNKMSAPDTPVVGQRDPCPCGSKKRYKMCCGRKKRRAAAPVERRTFKGVAKECDLVAMREIVPAACAQFTTTAEYGAKDVTVTTLLPGAIPALHRQDRTFWLGLQVLSHTEDISRDLGASLAAALDAPAGTAIESIPRGDGRPRLQDVLAGSTGVVAVHDTFNYWVGDDASDETNAALTTANEAIVPTERLLDVEGAYWCRIGEKEHLRWVLPEDEEAVLDALARMHDAGELTLGEGTKFLGAFRAHALAAPVWDLAPGTTAGDIEGEASAWFERYTAALAATEPLTSSQRSSRAGIVSRQLTLR